ncbi:MAG: hypothetical protein KDD48_02765 [Bdellovibrionales bacterium]|nr:hypothetical protein [Bdellovibrionales bacterium]
MVRHLLNLSIIALVAGGCGATATLAPESDLSFSQQTENAVWVSDVGDHKEHIRIESGSLFVLPSNPQAQIVQGVYFLRLPDSPTVKFMAQGSIQKETQGPIIFRLFLQSPTGFEELGQFSLSESASLLPIEVDLVAHRGQDVMLVFSVSAPEGQSLNQVFTLIDPQIIQS